MRNREASRGLHSRQLQAIEMLVQGKTAVEVATTVGVTAKTMSEWRNHNAAFRAELDRRRKEQWQAATERLRSLAGRAVDVLEQDLAGEDLRARREAAVHVLRAVKLYGTDLTPGNDPVTLDIMTERVTYTFLKILAQALVNQKAELQREFEQQEAGQLSALPPAQRR